VYYDLNKIKSKINIPSLLSYSIALI